jgi:hypothetical protein
MPRLKTTDLEDSFASDLILDKTKPYLLILHGEIIGVGIIRYIWSGVQKVSTNILTKIS